MWVLVFASGANRGDPFVDETRISSRAHICLGLSGRLVPTFLPAFHAGRGGK